MAKNQTEKSEKKASKKVEKLTGQKIVTFISNGTGRYLREKGRKFEIPAERAQQFIDEGLGEVK